MSGAFGSVSTLSRKQPVAELLHVLMLPDLDRADRIGSYWANRRRGPFAELLIDCKENRTRAVLVGVLPERR